MQLQHSFTVPVPIAEAWDLLLDVERVVPCLPGASLSSFDGDQFAGQVRVKLGAIQMTYKGTGKFGERDESARRVVMDAAGKDLKGGGTVAASIACMLVEAGATTDVNVVTDLEVTGRPAQFGRGLLNDVGSRIIAQFAANLSDALKAEPAVVAVGVDAPSLDQAPPVREPIDLMAVAAGPVLKRVAVGSGALGALILIVLMARRVLS